MNIIEMTMPDMAIGVAETRTSVVSVIVSGAVSAVASAAITHSPYPEN